MWNYLGFPKEYQVNKRMGKERYLRLANLTPAEQKRLLAYLNNIEVLYAIPFEDNSEIIVLLAEIGAGNRRDRYYLSNLTNAIASSFPYRCLLIVRCEAIIKFFIFDERNNTHDAGRSVVIERYASYDIPMGNEDYFMNKFLLEMQQCIPKASNAKDLHAMWLNTIISATGSIHAANAYAQMNSFDWTIRDRNTDLERRRVFEESTSLDEPIVLATRYYEDDIFDTAIVEDEIFEEPDDEVPEQTVVFPDILSDVYEGRSLDDDEPAEMLFIEFCAKNCRPLYIEFGDEFASEQEWLIRYVDVCNQYAETVFNKSLSSSAIRQIKSAFIEDENSLSREYSDEYDIDELIEMISCYL